MSTKRIFPIMALCAALLASCSTGDKKTAETDPQALEGASREELQQAVSDRDQLLSLMNEIQEGLNDIKNLEQINTVNTSETPDQRQQVQEDIAVIKKALEERRQRLEELEKKLASSNLYNANMQKTIESLRAQIESQSTEIERLTVELSNANKRITELGSSVDSLNTTVNRVSDERDAAQKQTVELGNELNTCYVAIGSSKELKEHKILESGFLRKTKIMKGDFDQTFFLKHDKRTLTSIPLHSKKAEIMTNQPKGTYTITEQNGQKVLTITNPEKFWSLTNYLVVKID